MEQEQRNNAQLANVAFGHELLLERILDYAIPHRSESKSEEDKIAADIICSVRVVSKSWRQSVTKILRRRGEPLFKLKLGLNEATSGKQLDQFVNEVMNTFSDRVPTFSLELNEEFFRRENHESLSNCFQRCGAGLVDVFMRAPNNGGSLPSIFPRISLPHLRTFRIFQSMIGLSYRDREERASEHGTNLTSLIQAFLSWADDLREFEIFSDEFPTNFEFLVLPPTITTLKIDAFSKNVHLDVLIKNRLPNLTFLRLDMPNVPLQDGLLFEVLDNVKTTLRKLFIIPTFPQERSWRATQLSLPVMEKLESLVVNTYNCEPEPNMSSLERCLPQLKSLHFEDQTANMFRRWTENSVLTSVRDLKVRLIKDGDQYDDNDGSLELEFEMIQRIHQVFPNVQKLDVLVSAERTGVLQYIFKEMKNLTDLKISVDVAASDSNSNFWDALLIGTTVDMVAGLKSNSNWRKVELNNDAEPSIKMLQELKTLHLDSNLIGRSLDPLISDLVFHFALLRMPKLNHLTLCHRFRASTEMAETWRNQGRTIEDEDL